METNGILKNVLDDFLSAYAQRDRNMPFQDWLVDMLREKLPDLTVEAGRALVDGIASAVNGFNQKLREVDAAPASGLSKEGWLVEQLVKSRSALPSEEAGKQFLEMEDELIHSNTAVLSMDGGQDTKIPDAVADPAGWNKDTLKKKAREIAEQVVLAGLGVAANAAKHKMDGDDSLKLRDAVGEALQNGLTNSLEEVKMLVAGAIRVAAENGAVAGLDKDTPIEVFVSIAGFVVEGGQAIFAAANGRIKPEEAVEKVCKAGIAACAYSVDILKWHIQGQFPVIGTVAVELLGGLFDHMKSPEFVDNVYAVFHDMAVATLDGMRRPTEQRPAPPQKTETAEHQ